ncbi:two-component system, OmpR family, sensor histidine kinase QseC [Rhizobium sp. RU35A]|uniref:histidine kinase n=1 Tax=Rhizobium straminoryzae TaxID=1387186 RepID=A0A549TDW9_9HYPH|nr:MULTISPECIES: ATP-binding protein [Rhizobium]TRL40266.1 sensor histidine kinase [Rhizobium straminoryzae]SIQ58507.1 two-component system, OmpR family, sensor histidine kinase QseC [Rhizobium sp. RU35A]
MTLSQRLFFRILPTLMAAIVIIGVLAHHSATREINNIYDAELINDANTLWVLLRHPLERGPRHGTVQVPDLDFNMENQLALNEDADDYADAHLFRVWKEGTLAFVSSNAFPASVKPFSVGFSDYSDGTDRWRVYNLPVPNTTVVIEVAEKLALRQNLVGNILLNLVVPLAVLVPAIAALIWLVINNGLSHIRDLIRQIRSRNPDDLSPVEVRDLPRDFLPLAASFNRFAEKLAVSLTLERRFSDLAAHELRTPQAGTKLLLQLLEKADSEEERQALLRDLSASNERSMHLIEQMLSLARVSHQPLRLADVNLHDLVVSAIADLGHQLTHKNLQLDLSGPDDGCLHSDPMLLRMMLDNLLNNAIKYSPEGGRLEVVLGEEGRDVLDLMIRDSGPGIAREHRADVFRPFHRLSLDKQGSGLGLAIVAGIAQRLGIAVTLDEPPWGHGLEIRLCLPVSSTGIAGGPAVQRDMLPE